jgi:hypothetical protein
MPRARKNWPSFQESAGAKRRKLSEGRPYHSKRELVSKGILSESEYEKVRDYTTVK